MKKTLSRLPLLTVLLIALLIATAIPAFAANSSFRKIEYEGKGKVDVEFSKRVVYKNVKVTVKDTSGKTYAATILSKDSDDLEFRIAGCKTGKTYKFTISGIKAKGTSKYKKITGTVKIPAAKTTTVAKKTALATALAHAENTLKAVSFRDKEVEKDTYRGTASWEVSFEGKINGKWYSFEYEISRSTGKILHYEYELDD